MNIKKKVASVIIAFPIVIASPVILIVLIAMAWKEEERARDWIREFINDFIYKSKNL